MLEKDRILRNQSRLQELYPFFRTRVEAVLREMEAARTLKSEGKPFGAERPDALSRIGTARIFYGVAGAAAIGAITARLA